MARLTNDDIHEILNLFEQELNGLQRVSKMDKMRMRARIANVMKPVLQDRIARASLVVGTAEERLRDVLELFPNRSGFLTDLEETLKKKLKAAA